jgi:pheromone shutdown protein TraB
VSHPSEEVTAVLEAAVESDPRVREEYVRLIGGDRHPVVLVGVVHDHPASVHRVEAVVDAVDPATVAVELPDLVVPGSGSQQGGDAGGEMAAAVRAAGEADVVGVDVPGRGAARAAVAELRDQDVSPGAALRALRSGGRLAWRAALGRLARAGVPGVPSTGDLERTQQYDLAPDAPPATQADHEADHLQASATLLRAFEPPAAVRLLDAIRERYMATRLRCHRTDGPVVAVVGYGHLDAVEAGLERESV